MSESVRDTVFISHANPEDNEFTRWLALRLVSEGYKVWSDQTDLLGGERFWTEAETAIRGATAEFVYVLSRASNTKPGPLDELHVALGVEKSSDLKDFVIPLHIDDLPYSDINVRLGSRGAIEFDKRWGQGLAQLLAKLEKAGIPKVVSDGRDVASSWWRIHMNRECEVLESSETCVSNWFGFAAIPKSVRVYRQKELPRVAGLAAPAVRHGDSVISFASARELAPHLANSARTAQPRVVELGWFLGGGASDIGLGPADANRAVVRLLREAWERKLAEAGLLRYNMSGDRDAYYLSLAQCPGRVKFRTPEGKDSSRSLVGYTTRTGADGVQSKRYWHMAVSAKPRLKPRPLLALRTHVLFSFDGKNIIPSAARLHAARRSQCSSWFNLRWRDLLLAFTGRLAAGANVVRLQGADSTAVELEASPLAFDSPVTYMDPAISKACMLERGETDQDDDVQAE